VKNRLRRRRRRRNDIPSPGVKRWRRGRGACGFGGVKYYLAERTVNVGMDMGDVLMRGRSDFVGMMHGVHGRHQHAPHHEDGKEHRCRNVPPRVHTGVQECVFLESRKE